MNQFPFLLNQHEGFNNIDHDDNSSLNSESTGQYLIGEMLDIVDDFTHLDLMVIAANSLNLTLIEWLHGEFLPNEPPEVHIREELPAEIPSEVTVVSNPQQGF